MREAFFKEVTSRTKILQTQSRDRIKSSGAGQTRFDSALDGMSQVAHAGAKNFTHAFGVLASLLDIKKTFQQDFSVIAEASQRLESLSLNMNVKASKLGKDGVSLTVVSAAFKRSTDDIIERVSRLRQGLEAVTDLVSSTRFSLCQALLQTEMLAFFVDEERLKRQGFQNAAQAQDPDAGKEQFLQEFVMLIIAVKDSFSAIAGEQNKTLDLLRQFRALAEVLKNLILSLDLVRVGGRLEGSRTQNSDDAFRPYIEEMMKFIHSVNAPADRVSQVTGEYIDAFVGLKDQLAIISSNLVELEMIKTRIPQSNQKVA